MLIIAAQRDMTWVEIPTVGNLLKKYIYYGIQGSDFFRPSLITDIWNFPQNFIANLSVNFFLSLYLNL